MTEIGHRALLACALSLAVSAAVLVLVWCSLSYGLGYLDHPDVTELVKASIVDGGAFRPEVVEKLQYFASLAVFPPLAFLLLALFLRLFSRVEDRRLSMAYGVVSLSAAFLLAGLAALDLHADVFFLSKNALVVHPVITAALFICTLAILAFYGFKVEPLPPRRPIKRAFNIGLTLASLSLLLWIPAGLILGFGSLGWYQISRHFNAYFYSISQVYSGKALLVDFDNQYGLYPHFLEPVFRLIGLDAFTFFAVMAVLLAVSFLCFYFVLYKCVKDPVIRFLGTAALLYYGYVFFQITGDFYFQYFPHRIVFPGLLLVLSYLNFTRPSKPLYYLTHAVCAASVLWNVETGAVVFITWLLSLLYRDLLHARGRGALKGMLKDVLAGVSILGGTFAAYALYAYLRYGSLPHLIDMVSYQYYFYSVGFYMLPMDLINPWNLVILPYAAGIVYAAWALRAGDTSPGPKMIFALAILGAGIFSYYQGRSHPSVLLTVSYPALLLTAIFTDMLYRRVLEGIRRRNAVPGEALLLIGLLFFLTTSALSLAQNSGPLPVADLHDSARISGMIERNVDFIDSHIRPGENVLILSYYSGLYYAGTHTASPVNAPGLCELLKKDDMEKLIEFMKSDNNASRTVFLDTFFPAQYGDNVYVIRPLLEGYAFRDISTDGNLIFYEKRPNGTDMIGPPRNFSAGPKDAGLVLDCAYDDAAHAFLTPEKTFAAFPNGCAGSLLLNDSYTIEIAVKPGKEQVSGAVLLGDYLEWYGYHGFVIRQDGADPNAYAYTYGGGTEPVPAVRFKLSGEQLNLVAITDDGGTIRAYVNGSLVSSFRKPLALSNVPYPLTIGNGMYYEHPFNGTIYGIRIYYRRLGDAEIADKSKAPGV